MKKVRLSARIILAFILLSGFCFTAYAESLMGFSRLTTHTNNMIKDDFQNVMLLVPDYSDRDLLSMNMGGVLGLGVMGFSGQLSFIYSKSILPWLSVPLFGAAAGALMSDAYDDTMGGSFFGGGGIIVKNKYFALGLMSGFLSDEIQEKTFDWAFYPVLNTAEYPFLGFLEKIYGYFFLEEKSEAEKTAEKINYLLNISFKRFLGLRYFEVYTRSGYNNFHSDYDLSNTRIMFERSIDRWFANYQPDKDGAIYRTNIYGLRVGGRFMVEAEYLTVKEFRIPIYSGHDISNGNRKDGYEEYDEYPFGLGGFPSVTLSFFKEEGWRYFLRLYPYIYQEIMPLELGMSMQMKNVAALITYAFPFTLSFTIRVAGDLDEWFR